MAAPDGASAPTVLVEPGRTAPLRQRVLRPHQSVEQVTASMDVEGAFAVAVLDGDDVVACVVAGPEPCPEPVGGSAAWRLRGMATAPERRGAGLGAAVLVRVLDEIVRRGGDLVWCNARTPARGLYERAGFGVVGEPWDDPQIGPHVRMCRAVSPAASSTRRGAMPTDRPARYAKQLAGHWSRQGTVEESGGATVIRLDSGEVVLRPGDGVLDLEASVPGGGDLDRWTRVVAEHLERFGQRDELHVTWDDPAS
ncbi:GNAT family N-acetyltransferase [Phycicoccus sp. CSK15P-2]|uniref:GNAT family N-acetyltransferase n=1 Tax=Phycicoccus sp. CSK15P-2 TaxID=2807627 RepID=UPI00194FF4BD|nr:GNAT family N-acetyltransferase [Phycicoccus sp. CSK15P-2]MBM6403197.1 GNAT family N-acetyltransferase [Phycicoccus sp. CSK15P-2]